MEESELWSIASRAMARRMAARQRLYEAFENYRLSEYGTTDGACPHCMTVDDFDQIAATPIAELTLRQASSYASAVWPGTSDFKYFLPRLLELVEPLIDLDQWDIVEHRLPAEGWRVCSEAERGAVAAYVAANDECARAI